MHLEPISPSLAPVIVKLVNLTMMENHSSHTVKVGIKIFERLCTRNYQTRTTSQLATVGFFSHDEIMSLVRNCWLLL